MFDAITNDFYIVEADTCEDRESKDKNITEAKILLIRTLDQLYLLGYDSGFTNPAIEQLVTDIKFYLNGGKLSGT